MDEMNKGQQQGMCSCGMCMYHRRHMGVFILRWLLGIVILLVVFWVGIQIGEFKAEVRQGYGMSSMHEMGMGSGNDMMHGGMGNRAIPMMHAAMPSVTPTATPTK